MSRIAKNQPISGKMYRHFAVITVAITVCLAIFADGRSQETITEEVVAVKNKKERQNVQGNARRQMGAIHNKARGKFSSDLETMPMEYGNGTSGGTAFGPGRSAGNAQARRRKFLPQLPPGMRSRAVVLSVSGGETGSTENGMLVAVVPETDPLSQHRAPDEITSEGLAKIFENSRRRSGGGGGGGGTDSGDSEPSE